MVFIPSMYGKLGDGLSWAISFTNIIFMLVQSKPLLRVWLGLQTLARKMVHISEILHIEQTHGNIQCHPPIFTTPHFYGPKSIYIPNLHRGFWGWNYTKDPSQLRSALLQAVLQNWGSILGDENMEGRWNHKMSTLSSSKIHFLLGASYWHPRGTIEIMTSQLRHEAFARPVCHAAFDVDLQKRDHLVVDQETHKPQGSGSQRMNTCINYTHTLYRF